MMPAKNLKHLMLRNEVVEAVSQGKFHIYAVSTVDEGISILTGIDAGKLRADGTYPENTINYLVDKKLGEMAEKLKNFAIPGRGGDGAVVIQSGQPPAPIKSDENQQSNNPPT
jgi:hypothetical protein